MVVSGQPLYVADLQIAGAVHNVVFVATENDSVYAFDADSNAGTRRRPLWKISFINPSAGTSTRQLERCGVRRFDAADRHHGHAGYRPVVE